MFNPIRVYLKASHKKVLYLSSNNIYFHENKTLETFIPRVELTFRTKPTRICINKVKTKNITVVRSRQPATRGFEI